MRRVRPFRPDFPGWSTEALRRSNAHLAIKFAGWPDQTAALARLRRERERDAMARDTLNTKEAAQRLGISPATLYDWLSQSDAGEFQIRGQSVTIDYFQGGRRGQGRIQIEPAEIERLKELMRVRPRRIVSRKPPRKQVSFPGIHVELGDPGD